MPYLIIFSIRNVKNGPRSKLRVDSPMLAGVDICRSFVTEEKLWFKPQLLPIWELSMSDFSMPFTLVTQCDDCIHDWRRSITQRSAVAKLTLNFNPVFHPIANQYFHDVHYFSQVCRSIWNKYLFIQFQFSRLVRGQSNAYNDQQETSKSQRKKFFIRFPSS